MRRLPRRQTYRKDREGRRHWQKHGGVRACSASSCRAAFVSAPTYPPSHSGPSSHEALPDACLNTPVPEAFRMPFSSVSNTRASTVCSPGAMGGGGGGEGGEHCSQVA